MAGATVKVWFNTNGKNILKNLPKLDFHVLLKLKRINVEHSVYILSCFNFVFLRQIRLQPGDDIDE